MAAPPMPPERWHIHEKRDDSLLWKLARQPNLRFVTGPELRVVLGRNGLRAPETQRLSATEKNALLDLLLGQIAIW